MPMAEAPLDVLDLFRIDAALSHGDLWLRYFELGGMSTGLQLEAYLYGALRPTSHDHDIIAHALNERFVELGGNHPVPYAEDDLPADAGSGDTGSGSAADRDATGDSDEAPGADEAGGGGPGHR
jgi:hypothetical protein